MNTVELTDEIKAQLKEEYNGTSLFLATVGTQQFVLKALMRGDWNQINEWTRENPSATEADFEDKVLAYSLVWPQLNPVEWITAPAGTVPTLVKVIERKSLLNVEDVDTEVLLKTTDFAVPPPSAEWIGKTKAKVSASLLQITIGDANFVVRGINRLEFKTFTSNATAGEDEATAICKKATLYPDNFDWDAAPAGYASLVSNKIFSISGFDEVEAQEL